VSHSQWTPLSRSLNPKVHGSIPCAGTIFGGRVGIGHYIRHHTRRKPEPGAELTAMLTMGFLLANVVAHFSDTDTNISCASSWLIREGRRFYRPIHRVPLSSTRRHFLPSALLRETPSGKHRLNVEAELLCGPWLRHTTAM